MTKGRSLVLLLGIVALMWTIARVPAQTGPYPAFQSGMRVVVGGTGALLRAAPVTYTCDEPPVECTLQDVIAPNVYGVVQSDAPVLDPGNLYYWSRVVFEAATVNGQSAGWVSGLPPYINALTPPQMIVGIPFNIVASYGPAPILTGAVCINDGLTSAATMQLQSVTCCSDNGPGQQGILICPWPKAGVGNHKVVIQAINSKGTADSEEFQFAITPAPVGQFPATPNSLRITPLTP